MLGKRIFQGLRGFSRRLRDRPLGSTAKSASLAVLHVFNIWAGIHFFVQNVGWLYLVDGPSMVPTMSASGEVVVENRWITPARISRGDLVTFTSPLDPARVVCKRVVGLPGDVICVDPTGEYAPSTEHVVIPRNHIWVAGDNAALSRDSRLYGPVPMALVKGKLFARVYPFRDATIFRNNFQYID